MDSAVDSSKNTDPETDLEGVVPHAAQAGSPDGVSRRRVVLGAAMVGAVGAAGVTGALVGSASASKSGAGQSVALPAGGSTEPLAVHVWDLATGRMDVFQGTSQVPVTDPALAAQLARAMR